MDRLLGFLARRAVLSILLVLFAVFTVLQRSIFLSEQNVANVARQVSFNGIIALGETVVLISGGIDISVGSALAWATSRSEAPSSRRCRGNLSTPSSNHGSRNPSA